MEETEKESPENPTGSKSPAEGFAKGVNDYLNHNITVADAKAAAILATDFVLLGGLSGLCYCDCNRVPYIIAGSLAILSIIFCSIVLFPRLPKATKGLIFWENIKQFSTMEAYIKDSMELKEENVEEEYAQQNWHISQVLSKKHFYIRLAIVGFVASLGLLVYLFLKFG